MQALAHPPTAGQTLSSPESISLRGAVALASEDPIFYGQFFFPKAIRQDTPDFHRAMWDDLVSRERYVGFMVFRGGAKTTIVRLFCSYVVAFGFARTILWVGKSETAAINSVTWLKHQIEFNAQWATAFGLERGDKWTEGDIEIRHRIEGYTIRIIAYGMTGSLRGVNIDDYRPDLIAVDDPCDEENTATPEQRKKISDLFFGALQKSLAPASEAPMAKMVLLQTVLNEGDLISSCVKDPEWKTQVFGCFDENGNSRWPARWATRTLEADKQSHAARNMMSLWLREMECKLVSDETASFPAHWLKYWEVLPESGTTWIAIDPTPPPKDNEKGRMQANLDTAVIGVLRRYRGAVYVLETYGTKSPDPDEFVSKIFELATKWKVRKVKIETVLFARMFRNLIDKEMLRRRQWLTIAQVEDKRRKQTRIVQEIGPLASNGMLLLHPSQTELISQFLSYPNVAHDDYLDMIAIGLSDERAIDGDDDILEGEFEKLPEQHWQGAP